MKPGRRRRTRRSPLRRRAGRGNTSVVLHTRDTEGLSAENAELRRRLEDAEATVESLRRGAADVRRAEEQLRRNAETFYSLIQNNPFGVYLVDADFRLLQVSAGSQRAFANVRPLLGRDVAEALRTVWPEPFASEVIERFRHTLETGEPYEAPATVARRQDIQDVEAYDWRIERITLPDGRSGVVCYFYDLSDRLKYEAAVRESEERYRLVNRATNDVVWDWDLLTNHLSWSDALQRAFGHEVAQVPETIDWWYEHLHPEDRERVVTGIHAAIDAGADDWRDEYRFQRADGSYVTVIDRGHIQRRDGRPLRMIGSMLDVTDRLAAEEALRESESFYRQTLESIPGMTFTNTPDGACDYVSDQWVELTGVPASEQLGDGWVQLLHPDDRGRAFQAWRAAVEGRGEYDLEFRVRRRDGEYEWFKVRGRAIRDQAGHIARWFGAAISVQNLKEAEEALREADRRKDEFLAMLAHELRNPLAPIRNAVHILRMLGPKDPKLDSARDMIERQVNHLVRLVDDLLDVSRVSRGKITLRKAPLDLGAVVRQVVETTRPLLDARRHELTLTLPGEPVRVEGDFTRLAQVVGNLLNNAAKYTDEGGRIGLTVERVLERDSAQAVIRVRDSGRGIDPRALPSLFDLFYQVDRNLDRSEGGLGIGLSLVKSLVEMHGGKVEAHSGGRGRGSEFVVRLPCLPDERAAARPDPVGAGVPDTSTNRILVVDDNRDSADSMALLLELDGHEVLTAHDGREAVEVALRERPRVVLLDIGLPYLDGYQACRAMREGGLTDALLVAMTGYGQDEDRRMSREAGFDAHLVKPVDMRAIQELLARRAAASGASGARG